MKVRAKIEPTGLWVDPESLDVPGQRFTGTVDENLVEGVFEIEHRRYDGSNPPPFPPDFEADEALKPYLEPGKLIESDDPVLRKKAVQITEGATDSWDATRRIAEWVAENIDYAIPGGGTARGAFDIRAGECGAHSNLVAALCRSVGIPARVVWGCMYIPNYGGAFGQHGWNEVYMGEAGWVPLDATVYETDYVDSGHIRIGVHESLSTALNPIELEVIDYKVASASDLPDDALRDEYAPYLGSYTGPGGRAVELRVQDGSMVVDIPGQVALPLNDPAGDGSWQCKITDRVFVDFERGDSGEVVEMKIHELVRMNRTSDPDEIDDEVPEELAPYLGNYLLAPLNAEFTVRYVDGGLAVDDPLEKTTVRLQAPDERGGRLDEYGKNTIYFGTDDDGKVVSLTVDAVAKFRKS
jgi:transglutaminase-like putative cysteine protease